MIAPIKRKFDAKNFCYIFIIATHQLIEISILILFLQNQLYLIILHYDYIYSRGEMHIADF